MDYGSTYNPTGDPLFHMPYFLRIDAMIAGNSEGQRDPGRRYNGKPCAAYLVGSDVPVHEFESLLQCSEFFGLTDKATQSRISRGSLFEKKYIVLFEE